MSSQDLMKGNLIGGSLSSKSREKKVRGGDEQGGKLSSESVQVSERKQVFLPNESAGWIVIDERMDFFKLYAAF